MVQGLGLREMWVWWVNFTLRVWGTGESQVMSPEGLTQRFHPPRNTSALKLLLICWHPFYFRNALELFSSIILECELNASHPGWTRGINSPFPQWTPVQTEMKSSLIRQVLQMLCHRFSAASRSRKHQAGNKDVKNRFCSSKAELVWWLMQDDTSTELRGGKWWWIWVTFLPAPPA